MYRNQEDSTMSLATKIIFIAALVLRIIIPFGYYLIGEKNKKRYKRTIGVNAFLPRISMAPREALLAECEYINIDSALGRTAAEAYCPCPPAIPAAMPGEILGEREIEELRRYGIFNIKVVK